ncbi:MAG: aminotransferase class V-fold PLP-dependent enzyme [Alphaproteobacteria bacterium]|nr:aminotransferase class V-fold PLP-dependent enzyme [Alphaproteobacteria bacterium]
MSLAHGRTYLAIPGPSAMPDRVLRAMHRAAPNIYEGELIDMMPGLISGLKSVARTRHHAAIYIGNGHAGWEAALANVFSRGDKALVLATGLFSYGWTDMARTMGVECQVMDFGKRDPVDPARVAEALAADAAHRIKAVLCVQVDTATSIRNDIRAVRAAIDEAGHPALLMVDCIACLGCDVFEMDAWGVDVMMTGSQKGLMTPPGAAFVFYSDKADAARERANCVTHYWDWRARTDPDYFYRYFDGTAPTHHLYGLREALEMIRTEGLENVWERHAALARAIWVALETWGIDGAITPNVLDQAHRSHAVTTVRMQAPNATALRKWTEHKAGVTLGIGLGMADREDPEWHGFFRIGHMGHVNAHMVMGVLGVIEAGLRALNVPHGEGGLGAAADILAARA